jgi:hypothetical protein
VEAWYICEDVEVGKFVHSCRRALNSLVLSEAGGSFNLDVGVPRNGMHGQAVFIEDVIVRWSI